MFDALEEQDFDPSRHDRSSFSCGVAILDDYIKQLASQHRKKNIAAVRVLIDRSAPTLMMGYYTLSAATVEARELGNAKGLPRHAIPCILLGRLAVDSRHQGQGVGGVLLAKAIVRCQQAIGLVAAHALLVDAKDVAAAHFYKHFGFEPCADDPRRWYLKLAR